VTEAPPLEASGRRDELAANLADVRARIRSAEAAARRPAGDVTLVVVTKTWPAADVRILAGLGVTDVGENRDQEALPKHEACADLGLRWHFIGQLQRNKARHVASYADVVESVDRPELVEALDRAAVAAGRTLDVLIQVGLAAVPDGAPPAHRGGAAPAEVPGLADLVAGASALRLAGVMAVAPLGPDGAPADPRAAFDRLVEVAAGLRVAHPGATMVSAGMSGDLEQAVAAGATHVRVGTAVLGGRSTLR
jgi:pyridoxal phosphate enzyme (YggS family)